MDCCWRASGGRATLFAMTSVTSPATAGRIDDLRRVPSEFKGLSCEPVFDKLSLNFRGIDWVIMGGGSAALAEPFHVKWALNLRAQCRQTMVAFFLKQLGRRPMYKCRALNLVDEHGGDWAEWMAGWRTRQIPRPFQTPGTFNQLSTGSLRQESGSRVDQCCSHKIVSDASKVARLKLERGHPHVAWLYGTRSNTLHAHGAFPTSWRISDG